MPVNSRSNNRILPQNQRAVDVAQRAIRDIVPVQQRKYHNAFEVQGYETIVYHRLRSGTACTCQSHRASSAGYLDEDGKMHVGAMETILKDGLSFKVQPYGEDLSPFEQENANSNHGTIKKGRPRNIDLEIVSNDLDDINATIVTDDEDIVGANGRNSTGNLDEDESAIFDADADLNDTKCGVCFGTGFVGGYAPLNGLRLVLGPKYPDIISLNGTIEPQRVPHAFYGDRVDFRVVIPRGVVGVDRCAVWDNVRQISARIYIDDLPYSKDLLRALSDGRPHVFSARTDEVTYFTHMELQVNLSEKPALFEFPKIVQNSRMELRDATDDLSICASPAIPYMRREDILVESTFGKVLAVQNVTNWNDRDRNVLGWELNTRVVQPEEILHALPRRSIIGQKATYMIRDNSSGRRRT